MKILVTGGAGFIGSALIRHILSETAFSVVNVDKLTYAGNLDSLAGVDARSRYFFEQVDICNATVVADIFDRHRPNAVMHLAAESHVDRSIVGPGDFIQTNIIGTFTLLEQARQYWQALDSKRREMFRFLHVSTDEVYGDLENATDLFTESSGYAPSSPYSASKASSDHLVRAWNRTYGLPTLVTNCSNNYGPYQFPEKLIPHMILNALQGRLLPVYGDGAQIRDWLYVDDHVRALVRVLKAGLVGETYNIGGHNEVRNIQVVETICDLLEELVPRKPAGVGYFRDLVEFVADRPGHDMRYAIDASKIQSVLNWTPKESFDSGIRKTIVWYLNNQNWWRRVLDRSYRGERLGLNEDE